MPTQLTCIYTYIYLPGISHRGESPTRGYTKIKLKNTSFSPSDFLFDSYKTPNDATICFFGLSRSVALYFFFCYAICSCFHAPLIASDVLAIDHAALSSRSTTPLTFGRSLLFFSYPILVFHMQNAYTPCLLPGFPFAATVYLLGAGGGVYSIGDMYSISCMDVVVRP